ncbi:sulfotransferase family protein [Synechococcus sp. MEDNS5]|uniref:sulfotransferase family 2 domain-containing protein n=1 Tax=Synechococcus sp. MEDNS5 TaxID=1442554 RepID=UPI00164436FD|nr:sulfotransferase family 2 domain-containing protein [Synechococcus sp. MEDNS5]QNJ04972.1 sulfotransferase family protein [Synechococcus sp. MEDNS5]
MPVDYNKKLVFVHIPKCAGTSVEKSMGVIIQKSADESILEAGANSQSYDSLFGSDMQHWSINKIIKHLVVLNHNPNDFTFFCVVRDPYDRLVSHYYARNKAWVNQLNYTSALKEYLFCLQFVFVRFVDVLLPDSLHKVKRFVYPQYLHLRSQLDFVKLPANFANIRVHTFSILDIFELDLFLQKFGCLSITHERKSISKPHPKTNSFRFLVSFFYHKDYLFYSSQ